MVQTIPGVVSTTLTGRKPLIDDTLTAYGEDVVLASDNVDVSTPTYRFRPGNVIVKRTSTGLYVEANDSNGDRSTPPSVSSAEAADTDWDGTTITVYLNGTLVATVLLAGTDDSTSEVVTALNTAFAAANLPIVASGLDAAVLVVKAHPGGSGTTLRVESTLATAFATAGGAGSYAEDTGEDADYRVTDDFADLKDQNGTACTAPVRNMVRGYFDESELLNLTADAKAVLSRRGSRFG
jgi:hypothetical protein